MHSNSIMLRTLHQRATKNIDMAIEPEEEGKPAHGRRVNSKIHWLRSADLPALAIAGAVSAQA
jgi:hypothetical protein